MLKRLSIGACSTVGVLVVGFVAGCAVRNDTGSSSPARPTPERDRQILIDLAHRQNEGLQLVAPCISKAQNPELTSFCQQFTRDHQKSIQTLQDWLVSWYPQSKSSPPSEHSDQFRRFLEQMRTATGEAFDEAFLRGMRVHHRQLSEETQLCQMEASRTELKGFCSSETKGQEQEIEQLTRWICQWFRDCLG